MQRLFKVLKQNFHLFFLSFLTVMICLNPGVQAIASPVAPSDSIRIYDSLVRQFKVANNPLALKYSRDALKLAVNSGSEADLALAYKMLGIAFFQTQKDSSYFYYDLAARKADQAGLEDQKAIILYNMAALHNSSNFYTRAITLLDSSIRLAQLHRDYRGISNANNLLGLIKINIHNIESARTHFNTALNLAREHNLYEQMGVALSNLSRSIFEPDPVKSLAFQREALGYLQKVSGTQEEMATILINIGNRFTNPDSALFYYKSAIALAENAHLPRIMIGAYNNMTYSYMDKKDLAAAEHCVRDLAIPIALEADNPDWLCSLYDTYSDVCEAKGDIKMALSMQRKSHKERVRDYRQKAADQVRLLSAQLDLQNKELIIQAEEKKILMQQNQLQRMELVLAIVALLAFVAIFSIFFMQHRNKVRFQKEKIESARRLIEMEETEKGRTARELHDLTGQLVLGISGMIENLDFAEPDLKIEINGRIKDLGASIRRISHRMNRAMFEHFTFSELLTGLCNDYKKLVKLDVQLTLPDNLPELPNELVLHFYRIVQELLTNAGKYAAQGLIEISVGVSNQKLSLEYKDTGPGFASDDKSRLGMGLKNIFERVKLVNGQVELDSSPGNGTRWSFSFPVSTSK